MNKRRFEYEQLNKFAGKRNTTGKIAASASNPEITISGTDTCEWSRLMDIKIVKSVNGI